MSKPHKPKNYSSNVEETLQKLKDITLLNKEIDSLKRQLEEKNKEIASLKNNSPVNDEAIAPPTSEETIARTQLAMLEQASMIRPLSLEEVRIYDLLVKNLRLSTDDSSSGKTTYKYLPGNTSEAELIKLAQSNVKKETDESK